MVCAGADDVLITNYSKLVWSFFHSSGSGTTVTYANQSAKMILFHEFVVESGLYQLAFMAPGESVIVPLRSMDTLSWIMDPLLSPAWTAGSWLVENTIKHTKKEIKRTFTKGSPGRKALWECTLAVYNTTKVGIEDSGTWDAEKKLETALGITSDTGQCAKAMREARKLSGGADLPLISDISKVPGQTTVLRADAKFLTIATKAFKFSLCALAVKMKGVPCIR